MPGDEADFRVIQSYKWVHTPSANQIGEHEDVTIKYK